MRLNDFGIVVVIAVVVTALLLSEKPAPQPVAAAQPKTVVVLVPGADGKVGAVSVKSAQGETVINNAYASATTTGNAAPVTGSSNAAQVQQTFGETARALPPPPVSYTLNFLEGRDEYTPESHQTIETVLRELAKRPAAEIAVIGHTDRVGALEYNDKLSLQRAERVRADFIRRGVAERSISVAGRGEREPLVATADEVAEARNRRVEINIR
ncbi:MAG: OmpA family protein [Burkholderiales bacterium]|jgi:outer membrane protein OmpA-like peptidoglycan-associated protein|nr:OmpA family protein [Burkholderiales bacterium]